MGSQDVEEISAVLFDCLNVLGHQSFLEVFRPTSVQFNLLRSSIYPLERVAHVLAKIDGVIVYVYFMSRRLCAVQNIDDELVITSHRDLGSES